MLIEQCGEYKLLRPLQFCLVFYKAYYTDLNTTSPGKLKAKRKRILFMLPLRRRLYACCCFFHLKDHLNRFKVFTRGGLSLLLQIILEHIFQHSNLKFLCHNVINTYKTGRCKIGKFS